jgi:DNA helicase HerA-like ATPase
MTIAILKIGRVVEVSGSKVVGALEGSVEDLYRTYRSRRYTVGQVGSIVKIEAGDKLVFGVVTKLRMTETLLDGEDTHAPQAESNAKWLEIELFGEALRTGLGESDFDFQRGVVTYPLPGQGIFVASVAELSRIYHRPEKASIHIGSLAQATSLPVYLLADELLGKHFAVLGTTGSGKSCAVAVVLHAILEVAPKAHVILLDPHNEYRRAFPGSAEVIDPTTLNLPHWLLNFEESVELFVGKTEYVATSQTNILKDAILAARRAFNARGIPAEKITVDTPVPYRLSDLNVDIERQKAGLTPSKQESHLKIQNKMQTLEEDSRFAFLVRPDASVGDDLKEIVAQYLRIPVVNKPLSIIDLSGVPSDVVDVVVSVLCRMIFDFAVWSPRPVRVPVVLVCEEAHRYAPRRDDAAFQPAKQALSRIAKEGRKYGVGLGLISQRPSELDDAILSQCNTLIALRMSNEQDQNFVQRALPDSVRSLVSVLPTLRTQESLVVGEGSVVPVRLRFNNLPEEQRPHSADVPFAACWTTESADLAYVEDVVRRWRLQERPPVVDAPAVVKRPRTQP